ncbi:hypothetical protein FF1_002463 [Malus domestica]
MLRAVSPKVGERVISVHLATDDRQCTRIGMDVLCEGGNAVDASWAWSGAFMLGRLASGEAQAFDIRETAPCSLLRIWMLANETPKCKGALSGAILGELAGTLVVEGLRHIFTLNGTLLKTGETCRNMKLAKTPGQISKFAPIALYN